MNPYVKLLIPLVLICGLLFYSQASSSVDSNQTTTTSSALVPTRKTTWGTSSSETSECNVPDYYEYVSTLLRDTLGDEVVSAIYDPEFFNDVARRIRDRTTSSSSSLSSSDYEDDFKWVLFSLYAQPVAPKHFSELSLVIWNTKRLVSIGLARLHRDKSMSDLLQHVCKNAVAFNVFDRSVRRIIEAFAKQFHTTVQIAIQALPQQVSDRLDEIRKSTKIAPADPVILLAAKIKHSTTLTDVKDMFARLTSSDAATSSRIVEELKQQHEAAEVSSKGALRMKHLFPLWYDEPRHDKQHPITGKFWNMLRPTTSCSSMVRLCELPEGCRLICNAEYLLYAGVEHGGPYAHRLAGFGCNNDYEWELSLNRLFSDVAVGHRNQANSIGWLTVFDCTITVQAGPRQWKPPQALSDAPMGFGFAPLCLDGKKSETSVGPLEIKPLLLESEEYAKKGKMSPKGVLVKKLNPVAVKASPSRHTAHVSPNTAITYFDAISFLKIDVEGFEHNFIPSWAREELGSIAQNSPQLVEKGSTELIDFETAGKDFFTVSLFSLEFHRMGHAKVFAGRINGALRAHYTVLHTYSLGFVMVGAEKNPHDDCCYEHVWAHYRHFVKSEIWMSTRHAF